jgi:hypothetical protein
MGAIDVIYKNLSGKSPEHVHPVIKSQRMSKCKVCEKLAFGTNCSVCACFIDLKTRYKAESCPIDKWKAVV